MNGTQYLPSSILVFGSQALLSNHESLSNIPSSIAASPALSWATKAVSELAEDFAVVKKEFPHLEAIRGEELLRGFSEALNTGRSDTIDLSSDLPNIIQTPLCLLSHLEAYYRIASHGNDTLHVTETAGFCTGLLSAVAVALSDGFDDLERHGGTCLRLAMLIGAIVDGYDAVHGNSTSLSASWKDAEGLQTLEAILQSYQEAYISVRYDENKATVTLPVKDLSSIQEKLGSGSITTASIGLSGRFHSACHQHSLSKLTTFCEKNSRFSLPDASHLGTPCWFDSLESRMHPGAGRISTSILQAMLVSPSKWWHTFKALSSSDTEAKIIITLGLSRCTPPSLFQSTSDRFQLKHVGLQPAKPETTPSPSNLDNDVAIIGLSCKVAGADDVNGFLDILCRGHSQHTEAPTSRFSFDTPFRANDAEKKWYGNFIKDHDAFDHKFFKKTPREAAAMDPQQRLLMEVAYQAVAQSGYFLDETPKANVGCYIGACAVDYECNVACHKPNAFSSTGNLRGFIAGKISHYFGWTGPGLTVDTACSGAAVSVHLACKAILGGECETALAGAVNMITQPLAYQNLAAASFLSPSGQCKPFCSKADGYCRGEGIAAVYLKKRSQAIADGDQIFGIISGTAVQQNENCTAIFVPNAPSLSSLFRKVLSQSKLEALQISYVEAHGTGTPVGDPAEYDSISQVFGTNKRSAPLQLGSVKGLVGHTESASGLASLVKVILMMHEGIIPPQASFETTNPHIRAHGSISISTKLQQWKSDFKAALINNYGASGSNASMVITSPVKPLLGDSAPQASAKYPFWFTASDKKSLEAYAQKFLAYLQARAKQGIDVSVDALSFNIFRQSNMHLKHSLFINSSSIESLVDQLKGEHAIVERPRTPSVIMCFGGQVSTFVGLDRVLFDNTTVLRSHLNACDSVCKAQGLGSIYPYIFQRSPLETTLKLQLCLFALQYSSAKAWIDCNVRPTALVGHSFGELTAVCISGALSLEDTISMIAGRAAVIDQHWGSEKGAMLALEATIEQVHAITNQSKIAGQDEVTVACYNGQRSFTLVGSSAAIDVVENFLAKGAAAYTSLRRKRLKVTNAFHSPLVDHLKPYLCRVGRSLRFKPRSIPVEFSTEFGDYDVLDADYVANHMRNPVYFDHAVRRLSGKHPSAAWLEIGSNSTVSAMAANALGHSQRASAESKSPVFVAMNITSDSATTHLTAATTSLWRAGVNATFWQHHATQTTSHPTMLLPPYQFERSRHWMDLLVQPKAEPALASVQPPSDLWAFEGYQEGAPEHARFRILTDSQTYQEMVSCHNIAHTAPICPATLLVDMAIEAVTSMAPDYKSDDMQPQILHVDNLAPICINPSRILYMDFSPCQEPRSHREWNWTVVSIEKQASGKPTTHVEGRIALVSTSDASYLAEFSRYERLVSHKRCAGLLEATAGENDVIQGPSIYKVFDEVVQYGHRYQGLQRLVGSVNKTESAGRVAKSYSGKTWLDPCLADCFSQVGGIWVNCMTDRDSSDMYIANGFEKWMRSPALLRQSSRPDTWNVLACHEKRSNNNFVTDIFIFDPRRGSLCEVILGISFAKISRASMSKILSRLTPGIKPVRSESPERQLATETHTEVAHDSAPPPGASLDRANSEDFVLHGVKATLASLSGLESSEIKNDVELADLGIDSLMGMELSSEIGTLFKCHISTDVLSEVISVLDLVQCIQRALGLELSDDSIANNTAPSTDSGALTPSSKTSNSSDREASHEPNESDHKSSALTGRDGLTLRTDMILEVFAECKALTDTFIEDNGCIDYMNTIMPLQTELCIALTLEAFEDLDCNIRATPPGHILPVVHHIPALDGLVHYLYSMLESAAGLIDCKDGQIVRTAVKAPINPSADILKTLVRDFPHHSYPHNLTHLAGSRLSDVLSGRSDGIKIIFGSEKGKQLATGLYTDSPLNKLSYMQMRDLVSRLAARLPRDGRPLRILELGAGTGGTTTWIVPLLKDLGVKVEYTFSDLAPSFVASARKRFAKEYPFMKFCIIDVEKTPSDDLLASQDLVLASNAIHATHSLVRSLSNMHKMLRPGGFVMMLEMTRTIYWVDMIFGLLEGWWLFEDGRTHAIAHQSRWEQDLLTAGFCAVDWTDGKHPESSIQRIIIACKAEANAEHADTFPCAPTEAATTETRQDMVDAYVGQYTQGFVAASRPPTHPLAATDQVILVTGATGSLGSHLVSFLSSLATVTEVICFNRRSKTDAQKRQMSALNSRGIKEADTSKLTVIEADSSRASLGLGDEQYASLARRVTHIIHNAWPMSGKRPLKGFETQFRVMSNLIDLASAASSAQDRRIGFQLVSSIAVVGHYPLQTGSAVVPEERMQSAASVLPNGYGDAKWTCELMLDATLHRHPGHFCAMSVRLGQVAGSRTSGYWNHMEHLTFMLQSSQTLKAFPRLEGTMSWTPVDDVASSLAELSLVEPQGLRYPIYHIDNPVGQPWHEVVPILAEAVGAEQVSFDEWVKRVRLYEGSEAGNPAAKLVDFFDHDYIRMSCGGLLLDTSRARQHCKALRKVGAISPELVSKYLEAWKEAGVLQ